MNYMQISHCNMVNGSGCRVVLWLSGCSHHCKGCLNSYSWDPNIGLKFDEAAKQEIYKDLETDWCAGITFSGGDPLFEGNRAEVILLAREIREKFPNKNIWLYTGYEWSEILADSSMQPILLYADVICDGRFIESLKSIDKPWVGSYNLNVIDVKERIMQVASICKV